MDQDTIARSIADDAALRARRNAQLQVAAIEVDGELDHIAELLSKYPNLPEQVVRQITRATAELIGARLVLVETAKTPR